MAKNISLTSDTLSFFDDVFNNARQNCIVILNEKGTVLAINDGFTTQFHYQEEDIVGKPMKMLFTPEDQEKMKFEREMENVTSQGVCSDNNYLVNGNGILTWVSGESILVKNEKNQTYIVKVIQSIHEQKTLENSLRDSTSFVESILRCIQDALVVVNDDFVVLKANDAFLKIFSPNTDKLDGIPLFEVHPAFANDPGLKQKMDLVVATDQCFTDGEVEVTDSTGKKRSFKLSTSLIDDQPDKEKRILVAAHENTTEKQMNQQREDLIGFASHELRNPLANMVLCTELLEDCIDENNLEEAKDYLARTKSNIMRLNKIISELHDATKAGSGHLQIEKKPFQFEEMVRESIETVKLLYPSYNIIKSGSAALMVNGDRYRLVQVLTNYLTNAIKYSSGSHDVWVYLKSKGDQVVTEVKDAGAGIAEDQIPFVFTRYFRAEKTRNVEGLGLGLYLSGEIIKAHHGRVWLESREGEGSTFYFSIPVK